MLFLLEIVEGVDFGVDQLVIKGHVLLLVEGAVQIIAAFALAVAGGEEGLVHVDGGSVHDGRDGVVEKQLVPPGEIGDGAGEGRGGQRPGGDDDLALGQKTDLLPDQFQARHGQQPFLDIGGELVPVHGQSAAGRHRGGVGGLHDEAGEAPHLLFQQAHGVFHRGRPERIGADQLGQAAALVGGSGLFRPHLVQFDGHAPAQQLIGGLTACQAAADNGDGSHIHMVQLFFLAGRPLGFLTSCSLPGQSLLGQILTFWPPRGWRSVSWVPHRGHFSSMGGSQEM